MSSCGRAQKWDETGTLLVRRRDDGDAASVIGVLLSKLSTAYGGVIEGMGTSIEQGTRCVNPKVWMVTRG